MVKEKSWRKIYKIDMIIKHTLPSQQRPPGDHLCFLHQRGCQPPCVILMRKILLKCRSTGCWILIFGLIGRRVTFSTDRGWMRKGGKHKAPRSALSPWEKIPIKFCFYQFIHKHWAVPFGRCASKYIFSPILQTNHPRRFFLFQIAHKIPGGNT